MLIELASGPQFVKNGSSFPPNIINFDIKELYMGPMQMPAISTPRVAAAVILRSINCDGKL
jgi:hypothetical protein